MRGGYYLLLALGFSTIFSNSFGQNRLNSRLFYQHPRLFYSQTQVVSLNLSNYNIIISDPVDHRSNYYGEEVFKGRKTEPIDDFFSLPIMIEIKDKIQKDFELLRGPSSNGGKDKLNINTVVEVFYPDVRGSIWVKSFAKVRLNIVATRNNTELLNKKYESFYITGGTDKEFEGSMWMTIEKGANVTIGMTLRKTLDQFYLDLREKL